MGSNLDALHHPMAVAACNAFRQVVDACHKALNANKAFVTSLLPEDVLAKVKTLGAHIAASGNAMGEAKEVHQRVAQAPPKDSGRSV